MNTKNERSNLDYVMSIIYGFYVKYDNLLFLSNVFSNTRASNLHIIVDLNNIFSYISTGVKENEAVLDTPGIENDMAAGIINMCAHYRNLYRHSFGVNTQFTLISSEDDIPPIESGFCAEYAVKRDNSISYSRIKTSVLHVLDRLVPYIPDMKVVSYACSFEAMAATAASLTTTPNTVYMVISKDLSTLSLCGNGIFVLRPKKYKGADTSFIVRPVKAISAYAVSKHYLDKPIEGYLNFAPDIYRLISLIECICGVPSRGLKSLKPLPKTLKDIIGLIYGESTEFRYLINENLPAESVKVICDALNVNYSIVIDRYKAINPNVVENILGNGGKAISLFREINMFDPYLVKRMNETIFKRTPLDLNAL